MASNSHSIVPLQQIAYLAGHDSLETTRRYTEPGEWGEGFTKGCTKYFRKKINNKNLRSHIMATILSTISFNYKNHFILDLIETWPDSIKKYLSTNEKGLMKYVIEENRLDKKAQTDIMIRFNRPENSFQRYWNNAVELIKEQIYNYSIVGFHCTRLTESEILDIQTNGLHPLEPSFTEYRITNLVKQNFISSFTAKEIHSSNLSSADNRKGNVCFFHCISTLKDEWGLYRLFRFWGGEAIYFLHEKNPNILKELLSIGIPCIVVGSLKPTDIINIRSIEERIIYVWLSQKDKNAHSQDCDTFVKYNVPVLEIINRSDPRFEQLTDCLNWNYKI